MKIVGMVLLLMALGGPGFAEIYKWRDAQGQLHFSDTPPTVSQDQAVEVREEPPAAPAQEPSLDEKIRAARKTYLEETAKARYWAGKAEEAERRQKQIHDHSQELLRKIERKLHQ